EEEPWLGPRSATIGRLASRLAALPWDDWGIGRLVAEAAEALASCDTPTRPCHGDFWGANLLIEPARRGQPGGAGVIDWEFAQPDASPLADATYFVLHSLAYAHNVRSGDGCRRLFDRLATENGLFAWARSVLGDMAARRGVTEACLPAVLVVTVAADVARFPAGGTAPGAPAIPAARMARAVLSRLALEDGRLCLERLVQAISRCRCAGVRPQSVRGADASAGAAPPGES
ncbi:MAG: hypothetical protein FJX74_17020, partial [Armatimonadetes bacterium]|nr:hypothetical protein [Armatimonadota bacterium]